MEQVFRRRLLAFARPQAAGDALHDRLAAFIATALAAPIERRPTTEGVLDVLQSIGLDAATVHDFSGQYDSAMWATAAR